jgi:ribonuclease G
MGLDLFINVMPAEIRAALLDDGVLVELVLERRKRASLIGNVYLGRVQRVMKGMEAAFVDIGLSRAGFLGIDDSRRGAGPGGSVHEGEAVLVQVVKDAIGTKGVQLSRRLTLPGRHLVFAPDQDRVMVSRQIDDEAERARLTGLMGAIARPGEGFILRTASIGASADELASDADQLRGDWARIEAAREKGRPPACLHTDLDPMLRILRDNALGDIRAIQIDDGASAASAKAFCERAIPGMAERVRVHSGAPPLFELAGIEDEIERICSRQIDLPAGGGIVIEMTEALTAIDVNSGRFDGAGDLEQTAFRTNCEAAQEAARQIRLRNIAGLIVIDFIHMEEGAHWEAVLDILRQVTARDRNPTRVLGATQSGLVEITRRRRREPLLHTLTEVCRTCGGTGRTRSPDAVAMEALRALRREARSSPPGRLVLHASGEVVDSLESGYAEAVQAVSAECGRAVSLRAEAGYGRESYDVVVE